MQCFIYRLVVAFLSVKCFHFWWLIIKESNGVITDSGQSLAYLFVLLF